MATTTDTADTALSVANLHKHFGDNHAVRGVAFNIRRGECVGILGPNGAGKSTTLQICLGATTQDKGSVRLLGFQMPAAALQARRQIGVVPQHDNLDPDFNCIENLVIYGGYFGIRRADIDIAKLLDFAGLTARAQARISELSGGMRRRLTLARALVNKPDFIFLDEPTTGLDPQARHLIWERLRRLQADDKTLLLTTHFMEEAERLCDRVYVMDDGRIVTDGAPAALVRKHVEENVVEVHGDGAADWLQAHASLYGRREHFGELTYCYSNAAAPLLTALQQTQFRFVHRPANLEDVFLSVTGRELRE